jgi:hypothetical protein
MFCQHADNYYSDNTSWDLRLADLLSLHNTIESDWDDWVAAAPRSWKEDGWLLNRVPVAVACRYGQNQPIANLNARANTEEAKVCRKILHPHTLCVHCHRH